MSPPSAGLDPPGRRSRATSTRISQVPRSRHTAAVMGVGVAAARTHPERHPDYGSSPRYANRYDARSRHPDWVSVMAYLPYGADAEAGRVCEMTSVLALVAAAASETGLVRRNNEDAVYSGRWLFAVADGMGGHAAGEVASAAVIESLRTHDADVGAGAVLEVLGHALTEANAEVARRAADDSARFGMGTTLTAMLWSGDSAALVHIGDSRAFRLRDGQLRQITEDHVLGNLVSNAGPLAPVLSRYLDGRPDRSPDLGLRELRAGDRYLICSDGLSPVVSTRAISAVLATVADPANAVRQLVALAEEAGGLDNASVIVIDVQGPGVGSEPAEPVTLGAAAAAVTR